MIKINDFYTLLKILYYCFHKKVNERFPVFVVFYENRGIGVDSRKNLDHDRNKPEHPENTAGLSHAHRSSDSVKLLKNAMLDL